MGPSTGTGERYSTALDELWTGLARNLSRLDRIAAEPQALENDETLERLRRLQYSLHVASEHTYGLDPPAGQESAHAELAAALAGARDATAEVTDAVSVRGAEGVQPYLHEWRGALFRIRLARLRLAAPRPEQEPADEPGNAELMRPLVAVLLALGGALAFAIGAVLELWPLWSLGVVGLTGAFLVYRP